MDREYYQLLLQQIPDPCKHCEKKKEEQVTKALTGKKVYEVTCHCNNWLKSYKLRHEIICAQIAGREPSFHELLAQHYIEQAPE